MPHRTVLPRDYKSAARALMETQGLPRREWQVGKAKIFLRACVHEPIEDKRMHTLNQKATVIQKRWKGRTVIVTLSLYDTKNIKPDMCFTGFVQRRKYLAIQEAARVIQACYLTWSARIKFLNKRRAAVVIQSHLRGMFAREVSQALREAKRVEEERRKQEALEEERKRLREIAQREAAEAAEMEAAKAAVERRDSFAGLADLDER